MMSPPLMGREMPSWREADIADSNARVRRLGAGAGLGAFGWVREVR